MKKGIYIIAAVILIAGANSAFGQSLCTYYLDMSHHYTYQGDYEKAIFYAEKALKKYPDSSRCYFERGGAYYFSKQLDAALVDLNMYVQMEPNDSEGYHWRGLVFADLKIYSGAESDFLKCMELGSDETMIKFRLAEVYYVQKKFDLAENHLIELIEDDPERPSSYNLLGLINEGKNNYEVSIEYFTKGIEIDPEYVSFFYNRARIYMEIGEKDAGCSDYVEAARLGAEDSEIWMDIHNCAGITGLTDEDKAFDKKERLKSSKGQPNSFIITSDYLPLNDHARYTYTSEINGEVDTAATAIRMDFETRSHHVFDLLYTSNPNIDILYFELMYSNEFKLNADTLNVLQRTTELEKYPVHLFPREFKLGKDFNIENTWNPKASYAAKSTAFSVEGIESYELPNGTLEECVKLRVETISNNGRNSLSYLWLVKDFGLVKWRNSTGEIWKIIRYAIPEYGSFPSEESKYLLPPPEDIIFPEIKTIED